MIKKIYKAIKEGNLRNKAKVWLFQRKNKKYFNDDIKYLSKQFKFSLGYFPKIDDPKTFNEKLMWLKIYWRDERCYDLVDKFKVRNYVKELGLEENLVPIYGVYDYWKDIDFNLLPNEFVIKTTHGGGGTGVSIIYNKANKKQLKEAKNKIEHSLKSPVKNIYKEWVYDKTERKIIIEKLLKNTDGSSIIDYKFYCFSGKAYYILAATNRDVSVKFDYFDINWNWLDLRQGGENNINRPEKPDNLGKMIKIAELLSGGFPHVRVDLYNINGQIYFGELTFFDSAGNASFDPLYYDYEFGSYLKIEDVIRYK